MSIMIRQKRSPLLLLLAVLSGIQLFHRSPVATAQTNATAPARRSAVNTEAQLMPERPSSTGIYIDPSGGMTADEAVQYAIQHNGELLAMRKEVDAAKGLVSQASLRANPKLDVSVSQNVIGTDRNITANGVTSVGRDGGNSGPAIPAVDDMPANGQYPYTPLDKTN